MPLTTTKSCVLTIPNMEHEDAGKLCERLWTELSPCQINCDTQKGLLTLDWKDRPVTMFSSLAEWKETLDEDHLRITNDFNAYALHASGWQDGNLESHNHLILSNPESCSIMVIPDTIGVPKHQSGCMGIGKFVEAPSRHKTFEADFLVGPGEIDYFQEGVGSTWMLDRVRPFHLASYNDTATGGDGAVSDANSTTNRNITIL